MRFDLTGRNVEITPALRQLIDRKIKKLERVLNDSALSAQVVLSREKYRRVAEITIHARGDHVLHGLGQGGVWPVSLGEAVEKILQQAHRLKTKWTARKRRAAGPRRLPPVDVAAPAPEPAGPRIVRATRYPVKPMSLEDAAQKVEATDDAFLVFRNPETDAVAILFRRKDGNLGLIEPDA
jgi:putative sigma-54 modulation protein